MIKRKILKQLGGAGKDTLHTKKQEKSDSRMYHHKQCKIRASDITSLKYWKDFVNIDSIFSENTSQKTGRNKDIFRRKKLREFIVNRPTLQEILKKVLQMEEKLYFVKYGSTKKCRVQEMATWVNTSFLNF